MDVMDMKLFKDGQFNAVFDKATLDSIIVITNKQHKFTKIT